MRYWIKLYTEILDDPKIWPSVRPGISDLHQSVCAGRPRG